MTSRNRRVAVNAAMKYMTRTSSPIPEIPVRPIKLQEREPEPPASEPGYEAEIISIASAPGVREYEQITINRAHTVFDKWVYMDAAFFERRHIRVVEHARDLWRAVSMPPEHYLEFGSAGCAGLERSRDDEMAARASNLLRRARSLVSGWQWSMFENVVRWNEPYGFPGSNLYGDKPKREDMAKRVVRHVAEVVSRSLFL